jgi:hypothetical protein
MKTYGEVEVHLHAFLTSALDGDECSSSHLGCFTSDTYLIRSKVGPRALDAVAKMKIPCPCQESNSCRPARSLVTVLLERAVFYAHITDLETPKH